MKTSDIKKLAQAYLQVLEGKTLDPVNKDELKGTHAQRKDKDIDNNGKVDSTDKYLHKRRQAISKAMGEDTSEKLAEAAGEDKAVTAKVQKHDQDAMHIGSHGHEHVYAGGQPDSGTHVYHIHNTQTGKTHTASLEHDGEKTYSHSGVHKAFGGDSKVSKPASKIAHADHKDEMKFAMDESVLETEATSENPANYQHLCAKQVTHESWGAGNCIPTMHAEATEDGHVEWYDVMFEHGIEKQVPISELKVVRAESHMHSKKMRKEAATMKPCPHCDGSTENHNPDCPMIKKEGWDDMMKMVKDKAKEKGTGNFDKKKVSTGTVYSRKANKDGSSKGVKENAEWTVFKRIMEKQDAHTKGATAAEPIDSKASQSEKDFVAKHGGLQGTDSGIDGAKAAEQTAQSIANSVKTAPKRPGDQVVGDKAALKAK